MISETSVTKVKNSLHAELQDAVENKGITGLAIALVGREGILWTEGFGYTDNTRQQAATPDSLFNLQSSGKMLNTAAFFRLAQQGLISLDTRLVEVYPEVVLHDRIDGQQYKQITYRHLLSHHAGLTHESPLGGNWDNRDLPYEEIIASIQGTWMIAPPGQEHRYSNCGMNLMLYGLQRLTNTPVRELVRREVIAPLEMDSVTYGKPAAMQHPEYVTGYDGPFETLFESFSDLGGGCHYASVRDFANFVQMRLNNGEFNGEQFLDPDLLAEARTPQFGGPYRNKSAGLGLFIFDNVIPGELVYGHAGGGCGYAGEVLWSLDHGIGVILETNNESNGFGFSLETARKALRLAIEAEGITLPATQPPQITNRPEEEIDLDTMQALVGDYPHYGTTVKVRIKEGQLVYEMDGKEHTLTHHGDLVFTADYPPGIKFTLREDGKPSHLMWLNGEGEFSRWNYDHISGSDPDIDPDELDQYVGLYQGRVYGFRPYGAVRRSGKHLEARFYLYDSKLEQHQPGLFFAPDGENIRFEGDRAWFGNRPTVRVDDPIEELEKLLETDPENYMLLEYNLRESLIPMLKFLGREEEAEKAKQIAETLYPSAK
ncbi:MAG: serine hydrolase domain-containing protein [Anaerolineales bacterium]